MVAHLSGLLAGRPVWFAASTHPGEEAAILAVHRALSQRHPQLLTIIAPRHPHRGPEVAAIAERNGLRAGRRSEGIHPDRAIDVYVADTVGEMGLFYRLSPIVIMGGSLVPHGGQNPIEPAKLGAAILHGPHVQNFEDIYAGLDVARRRLDGSRQPSLDPGGERTAEQSGAHARHGAGSVRLGAGAGGSGRSHHAIHRALHSFKRSSERAADARARVLVAEGLLPLRASCCHRRAIVYDTVASRRLRRNGEIAALPVVCIGNFTAGGAGKTPTAIAVAEFLASSGETPAFLSRGYGGNGAGRCRYALTTRRRMWATSLSFWRASAPAIVSRDRPAGARLAQEIGATVVIMDDGLQNPSLRKDCGSRLWTRRRESATALQFQPVRCGLQWMRNGLPSTPSLSSAKVSRASVLRGMRNCRQERVYRAPGAGSGEPARVFKVSGSLPSRASGGRRNSTTTLRESGVTVDETRSFPDHHAYSPQDIAALRQMAETRNLKPVTTEKDLARISRADRACPNGPALTTLRVDLVLGPGRGIPSLLLRIASPSDGMRGPLQLDVSV